MSKNSKEKLINRVRNENLEYKESYNYSIDNKYSYTYRISNADCKCEEENYIIVPQFTDDTILEQTYKIAHELGHYYINKNLSPIMLKIEEFENIFVQNIFERRAWKEAEKICIEENIPIESEFYLTKEKGLETYTKAMIDSIKGFRNSIFNIVKCYYIILAILYLIYKAINDGIRDLFGVSEFFKGINIETVYELTKIVWLIYVLAIISMWLIKKIRKLNLSKNTSIALTGALISIVGIFLEIIKIA